MVLPDDAHYKANAETDPGCRLSQVKSVTAPGRKGVEQRRLGGNWTARIRVNGMRINLGTFTTADAANSAYVMASLEHHKEFSTDGR